MPSFYSTLFQKKLDFPEAYPGADEPPVGNLDVDITEECTLRCSYCFKGDLHLRRKMSMETAKQMVRWLVAYSKDMDEIAISFLGGEPMLGFELLKNWMAFAHNYCRQRDKIIRANITTNLTVFTEEHLKVFKFWRIGIHSSIDGFPEVQDSCRVFPDGSGSSRVVEKNLPRIFSAWRTTHARSTIVPATVKHLNRSFNYFIDKGFLKVAFSLANDDGWEKQESLDVLRDQMQQLLKSHTDRMKKDSRYYSVTIVDDYIRKEGKPRQAFHCGSGRGLLHVDAEGFLWPCHRFNGREPREEWVIGHINGGYHPGRRAAFYNIIPDRDLQAPCKECEAAAFCSCPCIAANWQANRNLYDPGEGFCMAIRIMHETIKNHIADLRKNDASFYAQLEDWVYNYQW